ncbi:MAG TPA: fluoride efflux transporter CrcB [Chloroflexia bacterium]|nr:fluoride efflux transporter CrcB [Chloroflexia bacterium]
MLDLLLVGAGGFVGANARFILSNFFAKRLGTAFPYGTVVINLTGSFILGLFVTLAARSIMADQAYRWLIATGFCGGYTTFSTWTYETLTMLHERRYPAALVFNLLGSYGLGLLATFLGVWFGNL